MDNYPLVKPPPNDGCVALEAVPRSSRSAGESAAATPCSDYPEPPVLNNPKRVRWDKTKPLDKNLRRLGLALATGNDLYRNSAYTDGLVRASLSAKVPTMSIRKGADLAPVLADCIRPVIREDGERKPYRIPNDVLNDALKSEVFLQQFQPLDRRTTLPVYLPDFELCKPGYNDRGPGHRVLYVGPFPKISNSKKHIDQFLDVMDFETNADRTNAVAAALTVMLRPYWPGGKPLLAVTATKSHAGKDTVIAFACGRTNHLSVSYEATDWAVEKNFANLLAANPETGVVIVENARVGGSSGIIQSAFLERLLTDSKPILSTTGSGDPRPRDNDLVVAISTNVGSLSADLMNRALPIRLAPRGNVEERGSPIGNPRYEYLPRYSEEIEAELRGMIEKWKAMGCPLALNVRHPFTAWAQIIGGILAANGYHDFLANYGERKANDDPFRLALAELGAHKRDAWLRPEQWVELCEKHGCVKKIIPAGDRENKRSQAAGIGKVFSNHLDETFVVNTDDGKLKLRLEKKRFRRPGEKDAKWRYRFVVLDRQDLPDEEAC